MATAMKVLIACEFSGRVREAFRARGHDAWSCDLLPAEDGKGRDVCHYVADWREAYRWDEWDLVVGHPPCTDLSLSGARWWKDKRADGSQDKAAEFFLEFTRLPCRWAIENPIGLMSSRYRKPDQIIQPWQFGHGETKATCLWLSGLPPLKSTRVVKGRVPRTHWAAPGPERWRERSRTLPGIARAMAAQWSPLISSTHTLEA